MRQDNSDSGWWHDTRGWWEEEEERQTGGGWWWTWLTGMGTDLPVNALVWAFAWHSDLPFLLWAASSLYLLLSPPCLLLPTLLLLPTTPTCLPHPLAPFY